MLPDAAFLGQQAHRRHAGNGRKEPPKQDARDLHDRRRIGPAEHHLHRILDADWPLFGQQTQVQVEEQPGQHQKAEERRVPGRAGEVRDELAANETQRGTHSNPSN